MQYPLTAKVFDRIVLIVIIIFFPTVFSLTII